MYPLVPLNIQGGSIGLPVFLIRTSFRLSVLFVLSLLPVVADFLAIVRGVLLSGDNGCPLS